MGGLRLVLALVLSLVLSAVLYAGVPPVPIEGKMLVSGNTGAGEPFAFFVEGESDHVTPAPVGFLQGDMSPLMDQVVYDIRLAGGPSFSGDVWRADLDGLHPTNLTGTGGAGLGGLNCRAFWSPDGSQIAFHHADPSPGEVPCDAGIEVWVMNSDGTGAQRVTPAGGPTTMVGAWSPNGYRLLLDIWGAGYATVDIDGSDLEFIPNVGAEGDWSPDGAKIVSCESVRGTVGNEPGYWRELRLTNADGSSLEVLFEQFIKDSDADRHLATYGIEANEGSRGSLAWNVGPTWAQFSPLGDRVAFIAAAASAQTTPHFDPDGPLYSLQNEVWVYSLSTGDLTRITDNSDWDTAVSWSGHNTYDYDPEVTVDNTTVTFDAVAGEGLTTILRDDDPPELPTGYQFCEEFYEVSTTAEVQGPISICMTYNDADVPSGSSEADLSILHYNEAGDYWEDITVSRDPENNVVCGEADSLSVFTLSGAPATRFPDVPSHGFGEYGLDPYWAFWEIEACAENGVVQGYGGGTYQPTWQVTRAQMAVFIARAFVVPEGDAGLESWEAPATPSFPDVDTSYWCYKHVEYLKDQLVVEGYTDGLYRPTSIVTRDQMAVYISRAIADPRGEAGLEGYTPPETPSFVDVPSDNWAYKHIEYAHSREVVFGYENGYYMPNTAVTRSQMAVYVARAFGL